MRLGRPIVCLCLISVVNGMVHGKDPPSQSEIEKAIRRSLPLLEKSAAGTIKHRKCFTCHGHALPVFAMVEARKRGFSIDPSLLQSILEHTVTDLERGKPVYLENRGQGGKHTRAGYALWTLESAGRKPGEATRPVVNFLLSTTTKDGHWRAATQRRPSEGSPFTSTFVALKGIHAFAESDQLESARERKRAALEWLLRANPVDTEDQVFHLLALSEAGASEEVIAAARNQLISSQREDGGWAQETIDEKSDAYATSTVLFSLHRGGGLAPQDPVFQRGLRFLIDTQLEDGSWHVLTRSSPIQKYYESGYPHGEDQFISMTAGGWATLTLLFAVNP